MLNYRNTILLFVLFLAGLIFADIFRATGVWWYIVAFLILIILMTLGSVFIRMGFYTNSFSNGDRDKKEVAFTFDDGPDGSITPRLLDLLREREIKAAFFVIGRKVTANAPLIKRMHQESHIIGGHSFSHHFFFDLLPAQKMEKELKYTTETLSHITGKNTRIFRPPYGVTNPPLARVLRGLGYYSIGWSLKSKDTATPDANMLLNRLKKKVRQGDIILFHDTMSVTLEVLPEFIDFLKKEQFKIVRLDQMLNIEVYD